MTVEFDASFARSIDKIKDRRILSRIAASIEKVEAAATLQEIPNLKKLSGFKEYYRIKVGDFRLGFEITDNSIIRFILVAHRKEIYRKFP